MKVRCVEIVDATGRVLTETAELTVGCDYVVTCMSASSRDDVRLRVHGDVAWTEREVYLPAMWPASMFEMVSGGIPASWRIRLGARGSPGYLQIAPESWLRDGFWDDLFDWSPGSAEAFENYRREVELMLAESERE